MLLFQGSAADIIKIAMINLYAVIAEDLVKCSSSNRTPTQFEMLRGRCRILLQVTSSSSCNYFSKYFVYVHI